MSEQQGKQSAHTEQGEQVLDADLAQHLGLLDWSQLDPIGAGQTLTGAENEPGFFGDLGDDLLDDEGLLTSSCRMHVMQQCAQVRYFIKFDLTWLLFVPSSTRFLGSFSASSRDPEYAVANGAVYVDG